MMTVLRLVIVLVMSACVALCAVETTAAPTPLTMREAVAFALAHHPALRESAARVDAARATVDRARVAQQPLLRVESRYGLLSAVPSVSPVPGYTIALGESRSWINTLTAQQVLYSGGRLRALIEQAAGMAQAATANSVRIRQQVAFETERAFRLLLAAQQQRDVAVQAQATAQEHLRVANARFEARAVPRYDVLRAEVQAAEANQGVIAADADIEVAHAALLRTLGVETGQYTAVETPDPMTPLPAADALLAQAYVQRPELQAIGFQEQAAEAAIRAARGERRPMFSVGVDYLLAKPESPTQFTRWAAAAVVSLPVLDGGAAAADRRQAEAQREQVRAARDGLRDAIAMDVNQAAARYASAAEQLTVAEKRREQAEELLRIADVRFTAGVGTATEIADAQTSLTRARQGVTLAHTLWGIASAELRFALGTPVAGQ